jgi:UDP-2,3-diacylglucosamine hydrolase
MSDLASFAQLKAPSAWRSVDIISDLHLQARERATFEAWRNYMQTAQADAVFILGDLFELWIGDDAAAPPGFAADCASVLKAAAARLDVFFMAGNRDFLVGRRFLRDCGVTALEDPTVLQFGGRRWLLTHGDVLCTADIEYMRFRKQVRTSGWQRDFLSKPLAARQAIAIDMREHSEARKHSGFAYPDVDEELALAWLAAANAQVMIHGHTHRPHDHVLGTGRRVVLSDWDALADPPRGQVLRLTTEGWLRLAPD